MANGAYDTINHFACKFTKSLPILKKFSLANWMINFIMKQIITT